MGNSTSSYKPDNIESNYFPEFEQELPVLTEKTIVITGCTSGTGLVAAKTSARKGAKYVLMLNRDSKRVNVAEAAVKEVAADGTSVETIPCDLQDFASVDKAANYIKSKYECVDVLCNNAGVMALEDYATRDGYDVQMQTNYLSHFKITKELYPLLQRAAELRGEARIVNHSSIARRGGPLEEKYFDKNGGNLGGNSIGTFFGVGGPKWERYHQTKLANSVFTAALTKKLEGGKIKAVVAAPGSAATNLQITTNKTGGMGSSMWIIPLLSQSGEDGTMPLLSAMYDPSTESGDFWEPLYYGGLYGPATKVKYDVNTADPKQAELLWSKSEEACGRFEFEF